MTNALLPWKAEKSLGFTLFVSPIARFSSTDACILCPITACSHLFPKFLMVERSFVDIACVSGKISSGKRSKKKNAMRQKIWLNCNWYKLMFKHIFGQSVSVCPCWSNKSCLNRFLLNWPDWFLIIQINRHKAAHQLCIIIILMLPTSAFVCVW